MKRMGGDDYLYPSLCRRCETLLKWRISDIRQIVLLVVLILIVARHSFWAFTN